MGGQARQDFFFTLWTLKEAYVKARGVSLSLLVKKLELDLEVSPPIAHSAMRLMTMPRVGHSAACV